MMATTYINRLGVSETRRQIDNRAAELLAATVVACEEWADEFRSLQLEIFRDRLRWELKRDASSAALLHDICHLMPLLNREIDDLHAAHEAKLAQTIAKYEQDLSDKALEVDTLAGQVAKVASALEATRLAQETELASLADRLKQQIAVAQEEALRNAETAHQDVQRLSTEVLKFEALAKSLIAAVSPVNMTLTLDLDPITVGDERSPQRATLDRALTEEIKAAASSSVGQCGAEMQCTLFVRTLCSSGSLEVDLEIHANPMETSGRGVGTGDDPVSIAADLKRQAYDKGSALMASPLAGKMRRVSVLGKQLLLDKLQQTREELGAQHEITCMAHARIQEQTQSLERANKEVSSLTRELKEELVKGAGKVSQLRETLQSVTAASSEQLRLAEVNAQEMAHAAAAAQERLADLTEQLSVAHCQLAEAHEELNKAQTRVIAQEEEAAAELHDDLWERLSAEIEKRRLAEASVHEKEEEEQLLREELERMSYEKLEHVSALLDKTAEDSRLVTSLQEEVAALKRELIRGANQAEEARAGDEQLSSDVTALKDEIAFLGVKSVKRRLLTEFQALGLQQRLAELMQAQEMMAAEAETAMLQSLLLEDTLHEEKGSLEKQDVQSCPKREIEVKVKQGQDEMQQSISERELAAVQQEIHTLLSVNSASSCNLQEEAACAGILVPQTCLESEIEAPIDSDGALETSAQARVLLEAGAKLSARLLGFCDELHSVLESIREETLDAQDDLDLVSEEMTRLAQENEMLRCACKVAAHRARLLEEAAQKRHETRSERGSEAVGAAAHLLKLWTKRLNPLQIVEKGPRRGVEAEKGKTDGERAVQNIEVDVMREEGEEKEEDLFKADAVVEVDAEEENLDAEKEEGSRAHTGHTLNEGVTSVQSVPLKAGATGGDGTPSMMNLFHTNLLCANPRSRPARDAMGRKEVQAAKVAVEEEEGVFAISNEGHGEPDRERRRRACDLWHKQ
jgi:hypothetical protein